MHELGRHEERVTRASSSSRPFIRRRGRLLTRDQFLGAAWDHNTHVTDRAVDAHIVNLRRKIEPRPAEPRFLQSVRGLGYRFDG